MVITVNIVRTAIRAIKKYNLQMPINRPRHILMFPSGTTMTDAARRLAKGRIDLMVQKPTHFVDQIKVNSNYSLVPEYLSERGRIAGSAGKGKSKRRGNSKYYSNLAKRRGK